MAASHKSQHKVNLGSVFTQRLFLLYLFVRYYPSLFSFHKLVSSIIQTMALIFKVKKTTSQDKSALHSIIHNRNLSKQPLMLNYWSNKSFISCKTKSVLKMKRSAAQDQKEIQDDEEDLESEGNQVPQEDPGQKALLVSMAL